MPKLTGVLETSLYVADVERAARFYESLFDFARMFTDARCVMSVPGKQVLLLFLRGASVEPIPLAGGVLPPHDGSGTIHLAFACTADELPNWETRPRPNWKFPSKAASTGNAVATASTSATPTRI